MEGRSSKGREHPESKLPHLAAHLGARSAVALTRAAATVAGSRRQTAPGGGRHRHGPKQALDNQSSQDRDQSSRGMDQSRQGMDQSSQGMGRSRRGMDQSSQGMDQSSRGSGKQVTPDPTTLDGQCCRTVPGLVLRRAGAAGVHIPEQAARTMPLISEQAVRIIVHSRLPREHLPRRPHHQEAGGVSRWEDSRRREDSPREEVVERRSRWAAKEEDREW